MFETSYFDRLQDYLASGCTMELTDDEMDYYNALYAYSGSMVRIMQYLSLCMTLFR